MKPASMDRRLRILLCGMAVVVATVGIHGRPQPAARAAGPATNDSNPDLTQGGTRTDTDDWLLGPTGARVWIYSRPVDRTATARQILVTAVEAGSPADGVLQAGDVILGVGEAAFTDDARRSFGRAITVAEGGTGELRLIRWRDGETANVMLKLAVLGEYAGTAPYDCAKSKRIFERGCEVIASKGLKAFDIPDVLNALALLASGSEEYRPLLAEYAKKVAESIGPRGGSWHYAYRNLFLAEYVLATGDRSALPDLRRTTMLALQNQCINGMWGHKAPLADGRSEGYGGMHQVGLPMTIALVLARQAGVEDPALDRAIDKSLPMLRYYVEKGGIPYGDHQPWTSHDDNGKNSAAAVLFDLLGDAEAVSFFSRMALAAYDEREGGHTGNMWGMLWALPGVSRCGPEATGGYMAEQGWYYDLARNWRGGFEYQKCYKGNAVYVKFDLTGAYLLSYALPLKSLFITGKKPGTLPALSPKEVKAVIADGRDFYPVDGKSGYDSRSTEELLAGLTSWSPAVRDRSAGALARRDDDCMPAVLRALSGSDRHGRYGGCAAVRHLGPRADAAAATLRTMLEDPDPWLRSLACEAIGKLSPEIRKASANDLLTLAARTSPADPRGTTGYAVAFTVFTAAPGTRAPTVLDQSLEGVDRRLLYPAMQSLLHNDAGVVRNSLSSYLCKLTDRDLAVMLPDIVKAIEEMSPSDEMFAEGIRIAGLDLLSSRHIREGMALCVSTIEPRLGNNHKTRLRYLMRYGSHAKEVLPQLRKLREDSQGVPYCDVIVFDKAIAEIEHIAGVESDIEDIAAGDSKDPTLEFRVSAETPELISLADFIRKATAKAETPSAGDKPAP